MRPERWRQIERLYHSALEVAEDQRATFLKQACAGDDILMTTISAHHNLYIMETSIKAIPDANAGHFTDASVAIPRVFDRAGIEFAGRETS